LSTDGSGNVTIANSTFTGTTNGTIGTNTTFDSKYVVCTKIFPFYHKTVYAGIVGNTTGTEVLSISIGNATFANPIYLFSCSISYNIEDGTLSDKSDIGIGAYIQNSDASKVYRFGVYNTGSGTGMWTQRHTNMNSNVGSYWIADSDAGSLGAAYIWNQCQYTVSDVPGNRQTELSHGNVASNFSAGEALTLKVLVGSHADGINYNSSNTNGIEASSNKSFYCIKEYSQIGS
jgi:hypothetical protein